MAGNFHGTIFPKYSFVKGLNTKKCTHSSHTPNNICLVCFLTKAKQTVTHRAPNFSPNMKTIYYSRQKNNWYFLLRGQLSQSRTVISLYYVVKYRQTIWHFLSNNFSLKCVYLYVGILHHIHNGSKSSQWAKVNSDL